jgi:putative amide transporter protein
MTLVLLVTISMLWFPIGLFYLGQGDAKTCGAIAGFVGTTVVIGGILHATPMFAAADPTNAFTAILLITFGVVYLTISYCMLAGVEDLRSLGNLALMMCIILAVSGYFFITGGGVKADGTHFIGQSAYLAFMMFCFVILTIVVWMVTYGKASPKLLGWLLIILTFVGLLVPSYDLLCFGKLPF